MAHKYTIAGFTYQFPDLKTLLARASPLRSGDQLAEIAASSAEERVAAQSALANLPLKAFLSELVVPYEKDEVSRLIIDEHDAEAFEQISHLTIGDFRNWLLAYETQTSSLNAIAAGLTPEMVAAVSKIMRIQDLALVASKCEVISKFRNTLGQKGRFATRLQPNHPTDDIKGIAASMLDGLFYSCGDAVIGINPVTDNVQTCLRLYKMMDAVIQQFEIPTQNCVLAHVTTTLEAIKKGAPVDLVFQSIGGTEKTNQSFGIDLELLKEAQEAALSLKRGTLGQQLMYFETGQGSALSAQANYGADQQTIEARAYAVARKFDPLLVNTVVGFIGPEYLYNGKQIIRAGMEDHFCGKLLGIPMGCDVCYTNHAEADQDDMDVLLTLLAGAGCNYIMGVPGTDDIMLHYQSTSFHDTLYVRQLLNLRPAPEFEQWLNQLHIMDEKLQLDGRTATKKLLRENPFFQ